MTSAIRASAASRTRPILHSEYFAIIWDQSQVLTTKLTLSASPPWTAHFTESSWFPRVDEAPEMRRLPIAWRPLWKLEDAASTCWRRRKSTLVGLENIRQKTLSIWVDIKGNMTLFFSFTHSKGKIAGSAVRTPMRSEFFVGVCGCVTQWHSVCVLG